jgi:hypothetical protein
MWASRGDVHVIGHVGHDVTNNGRAVFTQIIRHVLDLSGPGALANTGLSTFFRAPVSH